MKATRRAKIGFLILGIHSDCGCLRKTAGKPAMFKNNPIQFRRASSYSLTFLIGAIAGKLVTSNEALWALAHDPLQLNLNILDRWREIPVQYLQFGAVVFALMILTLSLLRTGLFRSVFTSIAALCLFDNPTKKITSSPTAKTIDAVRDGLENQLSELVKTVSRFLETSSAQSSIIDGVQASLSSANTVEQIQSIIGVLIANSSQGRRDSEALRRNLREAHAQTTALRQRLATAEQLASLDTLTSLPNRRHFQKFLEDAVTEAHADYTPLSVVMADIDHFKKVNDSFGHLTGDAVLKQFAQIMAQSVRQTDLVARYGGEEFVLVLKRTPKGSASEIAERIRSNILAATWKDPKAGRDLGRITASFGIAEIRDDETVDRLLERADQKLYSAKRNGRNRVESDSAHRDVTDSQSPKMTRAGLCLPMT